MDNDKTTSDAQIDSTPKISDLPSPKSAAQFLGWGRNEVAESLGVVNIAIGLLEVLAPELVSRISGIPALRPSAVRLCGIAEIIQGVSMAAKLPASNELLVRTGGSLMSLFLFGSRQNDGRNNRPDRVAIRAALCGITGLSLYYSLRRKTQPGEVPRNRVKVLESITINRPASDLYSFWRKLQNLPQVMSYLESVEEIDTKLSKWTTKEVAGKSLEWNAEIKTDNPNNLIAWQTTAGSDVSHAGSVRFSPRSGHRGTSVTVQIIGELMGGALVNNIVEGFSNRKIKADLKRFKQLMESDSVGVAGASAANDSALN